MPGEDSAKKEEEEEEETDRRQALPARFRSGTDEERKSPFTEDQIRLVHQHLPKPVGEGKPAASMMSSGLPDPALLAAVMSVGGRIERGAIPFPLEDLRCSYCLCCHRTAPMRCSRCKKVFYCNQDCQKSHWRLHKKVCGTVTQTWDMEEWRRDI